MANHDKQTEDKIFEAATMVFLEKGMDGARMQDIADCAGINKSLLHYYFRSKERLFDAVFEKIALKIFRKFAPVADQNLSLEEKIRFFFEEHIAFLQKNRKLPIFLLNEINRNPDRVKEFLNHIDIERFWSILYAQHSKEFTKYNITREDVPQVLTTIVAMSIFPFAASGILEGIFEKSNVNFEKFLDERKVFAADFVISAIKNMNK